MSSQSKFKEFALFIALTRIIIRRTEKTVESGKLLDKPSILPFSTGFYIGRNLRCYVFGVKEN